MTTPSTLALFLATNVISNSKTLSHLGFEIILSTITKSSKIIINTLQSLFTEDNSNIKHINIELKKMDIEFFIKIINQIIIEQQNENLNNNIESIKLLLLGIDELLTNISNELLLLYNLYQKYNNSYFNFWKSFHYDLTNIQKNYKLLHKRYKIMIKILQIYKK